MTAAVLHAPAVRGQRVLAGVLLSMLVHAALLLAYRPAPAPAPVPVAPTPLTVHLQAPPAPVVELPAQAAPVKPARRERADAAPRAPRRVIAVAPGTAPARAPALVVEPQPEEAPAPKKFDLDAARSTARAIGTRDAPNADDAPLHRLKKQQEMTLQTESKAARAISEAKRGDCKDGIPGGLLAPLYLLAQKKDSGCKW